MVQDSQLEMRDLLLHLRPIGLKDKSLGEGIKFSHRFTKKYQ